MKHSFWCATWDSNTNTLIFGRVVKNGLTTVHIQHWVNDISFISANNELTPQSQPLRLKACTGCSLHDTSASRHGSRIDSRIKDIPCLFKAPHSSYLNLKHLQQGQAKFNRLESHVLNTTLFQLTHHLQVYFICRPHSRPQNLIHYRSPSPMEESLDYGLY